MSGKHLTLLEVHLDDGHIQIGPKTIRHADHDDIDDEEQRDGASDSSSRSKLLPFVLGLLVLGGVVFLARKFRTSGEMKELEELDALDESAAEA